MVALLIALSSIFAGCGSKDNGLNVQIPGVQGPTVTLHEDNLLIAFVFESLVIDGGLRYNIPEYQSSYLEISPDLQSGGTLMAISVSLQDVFGDNLNRLDPQRLPGGRALPGVASGALPAVAFSIENFYNMAFYLGPQVFGVFVPYNAGIQESIASFRFYIGDKRMGNISLVGSDANGEHGGILLMLDMTTTVKKQLKKVAAQYE